ncbi:MAG: response regulator [Aliifodinibius sp.]|nr:response regulator [Fodinibius sp.]NIY28717.1 response regulator [Fodinibius sp.]
MMVEKSKAEGTPTLRILLATKDDFLKQALSNTIDNNDCKIAMVESCKETLGAMVDNDFDLLMVDPDLEKLNGVEAIQLIKKFWPRTPMIVISDDSLFETDAKIAAAGVYYRFGRSFDEQVINELIQGIQKRKK